MMSYSGSICQKKVLIISHISDLSGPTEALGSFLKEKVHTLALIYHPFYFCADRRSRAKLFILGELVCQYWTSNIRYPEFLSYLKDLMLSFYYVLRFRRQFDICIGVNPLNALVGLILKFFGITDTLILYTIDWTPTRFKNPLINKIYHFIDRFVACRADFVWGISHRIVEIRKDQGIPKEKNILVPVGVALDQIGYPEFSKINRKKLVLLGALAPSKGIPLVIEAFPEITEKVPDTELIVIGCTPVDGKDYGEPIEPFEKKLEELGRQVRLMGVLSHSEVLKLLPKCGIGLAPYAPDHRSISRFADPSRVKDYLACGLPVIITPVPEIAFEIQKHKAGILINYNKDEFVAAVTGLLSDSELFKELRANAIRLAFRYDWEKIFERAFWEIEQRGRANGTHCRV